MKQKILATPALLLLVAQAIPSIAFAADCRINALETVAGLGSQVTISACAPGQETTLSVSGPSGTQYTQKLTLDGSGNAVALIPSKNTQTAGTYSVSAAGQSTTFSVLADRVDDAHSTLSVSPAVIRANASDTVTVTALLRDRFDNPVVARPIVLLSNRISDEVSARSAQTDDNGRFLWSVKAVQAGQMTLIPYDILSGQQLRLRGDVSVTGDASIFRSTLTGFEQGGDTNSTQLSGDLASTEIDSLELSLPQNATSIKANELFSMNIRALKNGELVRSYIGSLIVESNDPDAELPKKGEDPNSPSTGRIDMRSVDQGQRNIALSFLLRRKGPQTITVYDKINPSIKGSITINVLRDDGSAAETITILSPADRSKIKGHTVLLQGRAPSFVDLIVKGGMNIVQGETNGEGVFEISVELNKEDKEATLFVTSANGTFESNALHVIIDNEGPKIDTITIDPPEGKTGDDAMLTLKSEPGLSSAIAKLNNADIALTEGENGLYSGVIKAPDTPGTYDITVTTTDSVGNQTPLLTKWTVKAKQVSVVENVTAKSEPRQVSLTWKAVEGIPIKEYKIYIAKTDEPENYLYSMPTKQPVTSATIKGLPLGISYQFSLTAVSDDNEESSQKSDPASATPLGLGLTVKPGKDSLMLEWQKIPDLPLDHYLVEYGAEADVYTEHRTVDGAAVTTMIRDLINGVSYYLRVTPVDITGKTMTEYAESIIGTPNGTGFVSGIADPVPDGILDKLHPGANLPPVFDVPRTAQTGIPSMIVILLVIAAIPTTFFWRQHRKQKILMHDFLRRMQEKYHTS